MSLLIKKPMLAETLDNVSSLKLPVLATPKLDGIRCLTIKGKALSRKFLDIPNRHIQKVMSSLPEGLDGELMIDGASFNQIQSAVMSEAGEPDFRFWIFDYVKDSLSESYLSRTNRLSGLLLPDYCHKLLPQLILNVDVLTEYEAKCLSEGHEGIMVRSPNSPYKCGRSTLREGYLLKIKRFLDSEAVIIGFEEQLRNENEAEEDELGHTKRSKAKANLVPANTLGKFIVREIGNTPWNGKVFAIGTGEALTQDLRKQIWDNREKYLGKIVVYKYQPHGVLDLPRLPIWKGFRDPRDM